MSKELCTRCGLPLSFEQAIYGDGSGARFAHETCWLRARMKLLEHALRELKKLIQETGV